MNVTSGSPIHCVFSTDKNYCPHLAVVLTSLLTNNVNNALVLHIIHQDVGDENLARLEEVLKGRHAQWRFYNFQAEDYGHFYVSGHISLASYFRLFLTDILPQDIDRVVYIDADIVVRDDIAPLAGIEMSGSLGAVADPFAGNSVERLGLPTSHVYFNAGVLLIDLAKWRSAKMRERFVAFVEARHSSLRYHDQDVLNSLLHDEVHYLDMRWNFQARVKFKDVAFLDMTEADFRRCAANPAIVHFTANLKPWIYEADVPFEADYLRYREETPWRNFRQPDKTPGRVMVRNLRRRAPSVFQLIHAINWRLKKILSPKTVESRPL
jgi:lipopolysaccharide biosynthesis glycosyltransferase